ncbi:SCO family protein [Sphaerotilus sp.]|uniref:SCO family protein n=1 Tax=Sphaerotilus sp. TaxID=2093942 RepID=UPI0034E1D380
MALLLVAPAQGHTSTAGADATAVHRSEQRYQVPTVKVLTADGRAQALRPLLDDGRPVVLTFLYTSCTTVCPVTSHVIDEFVRALGAEAPQVNVVSVSIDPDHDTVTRLAEHARSRRAQGTFVTGDPQSSETVQRAFDAWRGDKMNHDAVIFLRAPASPVWVRLDGLVSPRRLLDEYRRLKPA